MEYQEWVEILGKKPNCSKCIDGHSFVECSRTYLGKVGEKFKYNFYCSLCNRNWEYLGSS